MSSLHKQAIKNKFPPLYPTSSSGPGRKVNRRRDYTPVSWDKYFDSYKDVQVAENSIFRVYLKGTTGPLLVLLHGGGYSGLSWSLFAASISQLVECQIAALDFRGHGETNCMDDETLSSEILADDIGTMLKTLYGEDAPPIILIGHSMGGAMAVRATYRELVPTIIALVVIDVVEGTALDALQSMQTFLRSRPHSFTNLQTAIEWCVRSGQVRNVESAKVSMPGQLKNSATGRCATQEIHLYKENTEEKNGCTLAPRQVAKADSIPEEAEEGEEAKVITPPITQTTECGEAEMFKHPQCVGNNTKYVWRIELSHTEKFWSGWFEGLSNMFLSTSVPKLLLLAGVDRLDKDLTIGQMQGKFQMHVLPQCGHAVHEDDPDKVAEAVAGFILRHKFASELQEFPRTFAGC